MEVPSISQFSARDIINSQTREVQRPKRRINRRKIIKIDLIFELSFPSSLFSSFYITILYRKTLLYDKKKKGKTLDSNILHSRVQFSIDR